MRIGLSTVAGPMACVICFGCSKASVTASDAGIAALDAGIATRAPPLALWMQGFDAQLYARALDISCAPPEALPGVEGCIALVRYRGAMNGLSIPASDSESYGSVAFVRIDPAGGVTWAKKLMSGFDPIDIEVGSFVDDDTRVHLLATNEFLVSGTYEGRVFFGTPSGNNQALGPSTSRNLFMVEFHQDGTFDNWEDTGNGKELRALGVSELPNTQIVITGSCQGDVPLDSGTFHCGDSTDGYLLTINYDGSTVGAVTFGGARPAVASDVVSEIAGNVYVSGSFEEQMQFGTEPVDIAAGEDDGFLMKVNSDGTRAWIVTAGGLGHDRGGRLVRVSGGVLWTALVSLGARVGTAIFPEGGQVVARVDDSGAVVWTHLVTEAQETAPLGVAASDDDSFALYGESFLGRFAANGTLLWDRTDADFAGASFTKDSLVVAATVVGTKAFGTSLATSGNDTIRAALVAFPR